ncbi:hypothetical protein BsWGS_04882 [Bradybaena similaris]
MSGQAELKRLMTLASRVTKHWTPTLAVYGIAATAALLYFTDWKVTNTKIPYYNKKFDDEGNL